jgi:hypothetical protein
VLFSGFRAVIDASVLFSHLERNVLLRAAAHDLFQPYWTDEILDETQRNLLARKRGSEERLKAIVA